MQPMKYLILLFPLVAFAGERHHEVTVASPVISQVPVSTESTITNYSATNTYLGVALGISASQLNFDHSTYSLQGAVGVGAYDGSEAVSIGLAKRVCKKCGLLSGSAGVERGKVGVGAGWSFRF